MEKVVWLRGYVPTVSGFEITEPGLEYGGVVLRGGHDYKWCILLADAVAVQNTDPESRMCLITQIPQGTRNCG